MSSVGNTGRGLQLSLGKLSPVSKVSIEFEDCYVQGVHAYGFSISGSGQGLPKDGYIRVRGLTVQDTPGAGLQIDGKSGLLASFQDCVLRNTSASGANAPVWIDAQFLYTANVQFGPNVTVYHHNATYC